MENEFIYVFTLITDFIGMGISLLFAIYLTVRGYSNKVTFTGVIGLFAVMFYYISSIVATLNPDFDTNLWRVFSVTLVLATTYTITHFLLKPATQNKHLWVLRGYLFLGLVSLFVLIGLSEPMGCNPLYVCPIMVLSPLAFLSIFQILLYVGFGYNLWLLNRQGENLHYRSFYLALFFGAGALGYGILGMFEANFPRSLATIFTLGSLVLFGYSVSRHHILLDRRTTRFDLPIVAATVLGFTGIYLIFAWRLGLSPLEILVVAVMVIFSHTAYDFVREFLNQIFRDRRRAVHQEIRSLGRSFSPDSSLNQFLDQALETICDFLSAPNGFIAVKEEGRYTVVTSIGSLPLGKSIPADQGDIENISRPPKRFEDHISWMVPVFGGGEHVALVGIGSPSGLKTFADSELFWVEGVTDQIGTLIYSRRIGNEKAQVLSAGIKYDTGPLRASAPEHQISLNLEGLQHADFVKCIEDGYRKLHDFSYLGTSPLVALLEVKGSSHVEKGKALQKILIDSLEKLRPTGQEPREPLPRNWHSFTILYDAYVNNFPARDIMGKLYISEGTYFRTRRKALRTVAQIVLELNEIVS